MKEIPKKDSENLPERVRRNTRPYVGVIDWFDIINTDPFSEPVQYYGSIEIDGYFLPISNSEICTLLSMFNIELTNCLRFRVPKSL